jgi:hypothetical protein
MSSAKKVPVKPTNGKSVVAPLKLADAPRNLSVPGVITLTEEESLQVRQANVEVNGALIKLGINAARRMTLDRQEADLLSRGDKEGLRAVESQKTLFEREAGALFEVVHQAETARMARIEAFASKHGINVKNNDKKYTFDLDNMAFTPAPVA